MFLETEVLFLRLLLDAIAFVKPLDSELIISFAERCGRLVLVEESAVQGGFGSAVLELLCNANLDHVRVECLGLPDRFIEHGTQELLRSMFDLDSEGIARRIRTSFPELLVESSTKQREEISR